MPTPESLPPDIAVAVDPPTRRADSAAAARMRRYRERQRMGRTVVQRVELDPTFIDQMVRLGWLPADSPRDPPSICSAFLGFAQHAYNVSFRAGTMFSPEQAAAAEEWARAAFYRDHPRDTETG